MILSTFGWGGGRPFALPPPCLQPVLEWSRVAQLPGNTSGNPGSSSFGSCGGKERWSLACLSLS